MDCPARWYYKHALKLPDTMTARLAIGRAVDAGIAAAIEGQNVIAAFEAEWESSIAGLVIPEDEKEAQKDHAAAYLEIWIREVSSTVGDAKTQVELAGTIAGIRILSRADIVTAAGRVIEIKTRGEKPRALPASYYLQGVTYGILAGCETVQIHVLCGTRVPSLQPYSVSLTPKAVQYAESIYAMVGDQIESGLFPPRRDSTFCSRDTCRYHQRCVADYGGEVKRGAPRRRKGKRNG